MANKHDHCTETQARLYLESIRETVAAYDAARERGGKDAIRVFEGIQDTPLAVSVRSDWQAPGSPLDAAEYQR
jgi:hypothetical protein